MHRLRVRYGECDAQGVVFNANYLLYFDVAFTELWREHAGGYAEMIDRGVDVMLVQSNIAYRRPARTDDELDIRVRVASLGTTSMALDVGVERDGELLIEAELHYVFVDAETYDEDRDPTGDPGRPVCHPVAIDSRRAAGRSSGSPTERRGHRALQPVLGAPAASRQVASTALRGGARADRQRRPARLRLLRRDRALLLSEVLDLDEPDGALRSSCTAHEQHPLSHDAARAPVPQSDGSGRRDPRHGHPHGRPLRMGRRPRTRLAAAARGRAARRARAPALRGGRRPVAHRARERAVLVRGHVLTT